MEARQSSRGDWRPLDICQVSHLIKPCLAWPTISSFRGQRRWQRDGSSAQNPGSVEMLAGEAVVESSEGEREGGNLRRCSLCTHVGLSPEVRGKRPGMVPYGCNSGEATARTPWTVSLYLCMHACSCLALFNFDKCVLAV